MPKNIRKLVEKATRKEQRSGSMRRRGRSSMEVADAMSTGRKRKNQSTDSNQ